MSKSEIKKLKKKLAKLEGKGKKKGKKGSKQALKAAQMPQETQISVLQPDTPETDIIAPQRGLHGSLISRLLPDTPDAVANFAQMMCKAGPMIGAPFRGNPGACLAITYQATRWHVDPFALSKAVSYTHLTLPTIYSV